MTDPSVARYNANYSLGGVHSCAIVDPTGNQCHRTTTARSLIPAITNHAVIAAPGYQTITSTATIIANGYAVYLPLVLKEHTL